ncbi:MAG: 1-acyl-sn-glycerol-3-phosphate acyltransferase, partial [Firmicutes bacterium]|nr:1-acyl-sn-glycerol-3-phosphate acyltransferase [Bacillota bacterium]
MKREPVRTRWFLRPLTWILSAPDVWIHGAKIRKTGMDGIKPPYVLLCNHNAFLDFKVATMATFPHRANYVVAIDGFIGREELLRKVGCICKRKFTNDTTLVRHLRRVVQNGDIAMIYPEARYSLCGTTAVLPASLGKLCKLLRVPVVTLICHGHHVNSPFWNVHDRKVKGIEATMKCVVTAE